MQPKFKLGQVVATLGVAEYVGNDTDLNQEMRKLLDRHVSGDWGDLTESDKLENDIAVDSHGRILSAYTLGEHKVWIITEADRSSTTVLFPEDY